jgi:hypothetical protein
VKYLDAAKKEQFDATLNEPLDTTTSRRPRWSAEDEAADFMKTMGGGE